MPVLRWIWEAWKRIAHRIGVFNTKLLLFLFYYFMLGPVSLLMRLFRRDLLDKKAAPGSLYCGAEAQALDLERARRQF
jgi:hypothetical protein